MKDKDGYVHTEVHVSMHEFSQIGMLAHKDLKQQLASHSYTPVTFILGLWTYESHWISFTLVVNDFGIKYTSLSSLNHLLNVLKTFCTITTNMNSNLYICVSLQWKWNYSVRYSMLKYIPNLIKKSQYIPPLKP